MHLTIPLPLVGPARFSARKLDKGETQASVMR